MPRHADAAGPVHPGDRLRSLMAQQCVAAPGAFNGLVARAVAQAGFDACYVSGAAVSASAGLPDIGLVSLDAMARVVREVADNARRDTVRLPVLADADTGFGEAETVRRAVLEYHRAGAAGLHIEDQVFPKRCGHLAGKRLIPLDHACEKIQWAVKASRDCSGGAMLIAARTDARGVDGLDAAIERARAFVAAGASLLFPEGLTSEAEFAAFADALRPALHPPPASGAASARPGDPPRAFLMANMTEFGATPFIPLDRFARLGYHLVIYPVTTLRLAMGAIVRGLDQLRRHGSAESLIPLMQSRTELYELLGYDPSRPWELPA